MKIFHKALCIILCMLLVVGLPGCSKAGEDAGKPEASAAPSKNEETEAPPSDLEALTAAPSFGSGKFVRQHLEAPEFPEEAVPKELKAKLYTQVMTACPNETKPEQPLYLFWRRYANEDYSRNQSYFYFYYLDENVEWRRAQETNPLVKAVEGFNKQKSGEPPLQFLCKDEAGTLYFEFKTSEKKRNIKLISVTAGGEVSALELELKKQAGIDLEKDRIFPNYIWKGVLYCTFYSEAERKSQFWAIDRDGNFIRKYDTTNGFVFRSDQICHINGRQNKIYLDCTSTEDGKKLESEDITQMCVNVTDTFLAANESGTLYLCSNKGIFIKPLSSDTWEQILDPQVTPLLGTGSFLFGNDHQFIEKASGDDYYVYSYDDDAETESVLTIFSLSDENVGGYAMGIPDQTSLEIAVQKYMAKHPEVSIQIHGLETEGQETAGDAVKSLNARLLNGEGEDIIMLDGLRASSMIEKGVLSDLSGIAGEVELCSKILAEPFTKDGKVYGIPSRFRAPLLMGSAKNMEGVEDLHSLVEKCKKLKKEAPDINPLLFMKAEKLAEVFYPVCAPAWIQEGRFNQELFTGFLTDLSELIKLGNDTYDKKGQFWCQQNRFSFDNHKTVITPELFYHVNDLGDLIVFFDSYHTIASMEPKATENRKELYMAMPGQGGGVLIPSRIFSINQNSGKQELARDFIRSALSGDGMEKDSEIPFFDGIPAASSLLRPFLELKRSSHLKIPLTLSNDGTEVKMIIPSTGDLDRICEIVETMDMVYVREAELYNMIVPQVVKYLDNKQTLEKTVDIVSQKINLYLKE